MITVPDLCLWLSGFLAGLGTTLLAAVVSATVRHFFSRRCSPGRTDTCASTLIRRV